MSPADPVRRQATRRFVASVRQSTLPVDGVEGDLDAASLREREPAMALSGDIGLIFPMDGVVPAMLKPSACASSSAWSSCGGGPVEQDWSMGRTSLIFSVRHHSTERPKTGQLHPLEPECPGFVWAEG
jgi:hypothetical protein